MENTRIALVAMKEDVRVGGRKYGLSMPALLCDVCSCIPDVMLCLYLLYPYYHDHAHAIKSA